MSRWLREVNLTCPIHITGRVNNREHFPLPLEEVWLILSESLYFLSKAFELQTISFVLMPNHFHLLATDAQGIMPKAMLWFMRETSREMGRRSGKINRIWGGPYHSSIIKNPLYFFHAYKYVYRNPVRAGLSDCVIRYPFSTLGVLLGQRCDIIPTTYDHILMNDPECTLQWLSEPLPAEENESIRRALRKRTFKFRQHPRTRKPVSLEQWKSVPSNLVPTES